MAANTLSCSALYPSLGDAQGDAGGGLQHKVLLPSIFCLGIINVGFLQQGLCTSSALPRRG